MSRVEWKQLYLKKQYRPKLEPYYHEDLIGYDTETIDGKAVLITDSKGDVLYPQSFLDCLTFLSRKRYRGILGWFKNINYDTEAILKWCDEKTIREFKTSCEMDVPINDGNIKIKYIPGKMLKIVRNKHSFVYFDIGNFLKGSLDSLAKEYLNDEKLEAPVDWKNEKLTIDDFKKPEMVEYCKHDSHITEQLAQVFLKACNNFGIFSKNYCSPASLATHYFLSEIDIPTLSQLTQGRPYRSKIAYEAYKGGFITTFKKGYFPKVYLYDLNSAYPWVMSKLPNLLKGDFYFRMGKVPDKAEMGWLRCIVKTPENKRSQFDPCYFSPLPIYLKKFNKNFYLTGSIKTTITLMEYHALKNDFEIIPKDGIYWEPTENIEYLYNNVINRLYELKSEYKNGDKNLYQLIKILLNGFYGKTIQKIQDAESQEFNTGNLFNPFHASYITAGCRIEGYKLIKKHGADKAIAIMTDGVAFTEEIDEPLSKNLGEWGLDMVGEGVFIGSGLYTIRSKNKIKTATRGFKLTDKYDFFRLLAENSKKENIGLPQTVRLSFKEALRLKKFDQWNLIKDGIKNIKINCDNKRMWERDFENCGDVLNSIIDSQPIFVNMA